MFPRILRRARRRSRTSSVPPRPHLHGKPPVWRSRLAWAALLTLIASALYFSMGGSEPSAPSPTQITR